MPRWNSARPLATARRRAVVVVIGILAAAVIAVVVAVAAALAPTEGQVVATIDGSPVTRPELTFHMERVRPEIENEAATHGSGQDLDERLRHAALEEIAIDRVLFELGREHELTDIESFSDLGTELETTNAARAEQVANGEVVYGLTSFSIDEYYTRTITELRTGLQRALSSGPDPELAVTEGEIEQYFSEHPDEWAAGATTYLATRLQVPASAGLSPEAITEAIARHGGLEASAAAISGAVVTDVQIDSEGLIDGEPLSPDAVGQLRALEPGGVTDPQTDRGGWAVYRLDEASVDAEAALSQYATRIRTVLIEERFDALIAERVTQQTTDLISTEWNAVKMEEIQR